MLRVDAWLRPAPTSVRSAFVELDQPWDAGFIRAPCCASLDRFDWGRGRDGRGGEDTGCIGIVVVLAVVLLSACSSTREPAAAVECARR